jgi:sec-independent protein translocase protein TatC
MVSSTLLFYIGLAFAYFVVFPLAFGFLGAIELEGVQTMPDISSYLDTVLKMFFAFGITFEIPVAIILLVKMGITTQESLREKSPYVIVGVFVVGMLLTPPDIISQTLLAIPMWALYEVGIYFSGFVKIQSREQPTSR